MATAGMDSRDTGALYVYELRCMQIDGVVSFNDVLLLAGVTIWLVQVGKEGCVKEWHTSRKTTRERST